MIFPTLNFSVEKWKFNHEFGVYVSNQGHFKDRQKRNLSNKIQNGSGYCAIRTEKGYIKAHRLVMLTWRPIPNRENMTIDHLNHNKRDNSLKNLEWVTADENLRRAVRDICPLAHDIANVETSKNYIRLNGIVFGLEEAINFITYNTKNSSVAPKGSVKKALNEFIKNPTCKKITKYNFIIEKI